MDFLKGSIRQVYFRYLSAAFGSAIITSVYSVVDMAMVGQYQGPDGTAALAVVAPVWNIIYSLGLLMGIGGSVIFSIERGHDAGDRGTADQYFTASVCGSVVLAALAWAALLLLETPLLRFFGADAQLLPLAQEYLRPVRWVFPLFLFNQMLAAFLRNDNDPLLATVGVLSGGVFNIFGDWFFVFPCKMGVFGAGLATSIGSAVSFLVMMTHFVKRTNTLRLVKPEKLLQKLRKITVIGFSSFFIDAAMGILTVLFNRQIMVYLGSDALAVYGPIITVSTFVQCCAYSVGQASQPIISTNFGSSQGGRIRETLRYALGTTAVFGIFWTALSMLCPDLYIRIFMSPTPEVLQIAPAIIRTYALSFLLLPFNIFSTYYFQAILQPRTSFIVSVMRGLVISGLLIILLPRFAAADALWLAMPITEVVTAVYAAASVRHYTKLLPEAAA